MYQEITDEKILNKLKGDKDLSTLDLKGLDIAAVTVNLEGANFQEADVSGANFSGVNLTGAHFERAVLGQANFTGATLKNSFFEDINIFPGTLFNSAICNDISFTGSILSNGNFNEAHFEGTRTFNNIDFSAGHFDGAYFNDCEFRNCDFSQCDFKHAHFNGATLRGLDVVGAHLEDADFSGANFISVVFDNSFFKGTIFEGVVYDQSTIENLMRAPLSKVQRDQLDIEFSLFDLLIEKNPNIPEIIEEIESNNFDPEEKDQTGKNSLMVACLKGMEDVALALINTGKFDLYYMSNNGDNVFKFATQKNLTQVLDAFPRNIININETGFDTINQEDVVIGDYLKQNPYHVVLMINSSYYFTSKDAIKKQINNSANVKYGCIRAGDPPEDMDEDNIYVQDENIIYNTLYFSLSSLFGLQILIKLENAKTIMNVTSGNMFVLRKAFTLPAIISKQYVDGEGGGMSADHCQTGKETDVYNVFSASADCGAGAKIETAQEAKADVEEKTTNQVTISYKEGKYPLPIDLSTTTDNLKELLLDSLKSKGIIDSDKNYNVRFIFKGKVLNDDIPLEIKENPSALTIQAMVNEIKGGRKTKRIKRKNMKRRTIKKKIEKQIKNKRKTKKNI
jgi:uncharacterized protein YjbI with pentapeptide repeats